MDFENEVEIEVEAELERLIHPNLKLLSYNSQKTLHGCPRKFFLYRLMKQQLSEEAEGETRNIHFDFGSLVGFGTQQIFLENLQSSFGGNFFPIEFELFRQWKGDLEEGVGEKDKKNFFHALHAVEKFRTVAATLLKDYEVVWYEDEKQFGKPAVELGFLIDCGEGFTYRGFMDALLFNRVTKQFAVWEGKTTKFSRVSEASYKNSSQGIGYSVVVDAIAQRLGIVSPQSYELIYGVYKTSSMEWELLKFKKSFTQRALWIKNILLDMKRIADYAEADYWPLHGEHCYSYFRNCEYFDVCEMSDSILLDREPKLIEEKEDKYEFKFTLAELIAAQLEKSLRQQQSEEEEKEENK